MAHRPARRNRAGADVCAAVRGDCSDDMVVRRRLRRARAREAQGEACPGCPAGISSGNRYTSRHLACSMKISRRTFIALGAGALAGCGKPSDIRNSMRRFIGEPTASPLEGSLTAPLAAEIDDASHVLNRLTFGARPGDYARVSAMGAQALIDEQLAPSKIRDTLCERVIRHEFDSLADPESRLFPRKGDDKDPLVTLFPAMKDRGARVGDLYEMKEKVLLNDLTRATILRAVLSERQFFEVMVQFWTDHFNIDPSKGECRWLKAADDRDVIRAHALGNFRDMVRASAVSPAMLWYLDGRENRRRSTNEKPNENYARELMELHTLGVHGGYTQQDVMEEGRVP